MYEGVCKKGVESFAIFVGADSTFILFPYAFHTWSEFKLESKMPYLHIWINNFRSPDDIIRMHMQLADICPGTRDPAITNNIKCGANIWNVETSLGWAGLGWRGSGIWFMLTSNKIQSGHFSKSTCLIVCSSIQISLCSAARPHRQIGTRLRDGFKTYLIYFSCSLNSFWV